MRIEDDHLDCQSSSGTLSKMSPWIFILPAIEGCGSRFAGLSFSSVKTMTSTRWFGKLQNELTAYELLNAAFDFHAEIPSR
jgi:hypothetical protein